MSKYELTDGQVERLIALLKGDEFDANPGELIDTLQSQIPQPPPTGLGAVVELADGAHAVLADPGSASEWVVRYGDGDYRWERTSDLPRIIEVLSHGVTI